MKPTMDAKTIYVRQDPYTGLWETFAKDSGHAFILQGFDDKEEAVRGASRVLYALIKYGKDNYKKYDWQDEEFDDYPEYPVVEQ